MKKEYKVTAQTRQNLIDSFWQLYCEKRIEKITVKEIVEKAGYNRSTFYEYFTDVYDVLEQIEDYLIPSFEELPPFGSSLQPIGMPMEMYLSLFEKNRKYYSVLLGDHGDPSFARKLKETTKPILLQGFTNKNQANLVELDFIIEYILSSMIGIMSYWLQKEGELPVQDLILLMQDLMENGVTKRVMGKD